jgi:hypothetical protein
MSAFSKNRISAQPQAPDHNRGEGRKINSLLAALKSELFISSTSWSTEIVFITWVRQHNVCIDIL